MAEQVKSAFDLFRRGNNLRLGYAYYCGRCKQEGFEPVDFRTWARADAEYDIEWKAATLEYEAETTERE